MTWRREADIGNAISISFSVHFFETDLSLQNLKRSVVCTFNGIEYFVLEWESRADLGPKEKLA
jgi:hypothetical protein